MMQFDADGDGKVSKQEAPERMQEGFDAMDTNKDGALDQAEIKALRDMMRAKFRGGGGPGGGPPARIVSAVCGRSQRAQTYRIQFCRVDLAIWLANCPAKLNSVRLSPGCTPAAGIPRTKTMNSLAPTEKP